MTLHIYPTGFIETPYVAQIELKEESDSPDKTIPTHVSTQGVETIILLDISGSMGQNVGRCIRDYIPNALENAGFSPDERIHLVTFGSTAEIRHYTIDDLRNSKQGVNGCTYMAPGVRSVADIIRSSPCTNIRLISISDGELHDQLETAKVANILADEVKGKYLVTSTAIRLFTSSSQPDTRGLSSLLQLSTDAGKNFIIDINAFEERVSIIDRISDLLRDDLGSDTKLSCKLPILLSTPWSDATDELHLQKGQNTFWLRDLPTAGDFRVKFTGSRKDEGPDGLPEKEIQLEIGDRLNFDSYNSILKDKVEYFLKRLRILKVLNTSQAQKEVASIVGYFQQLEKCFIMNDPSVADILNNTLQSRLAFFRDVCKKKTRSVGLKMAEIANDDRVSQLNSAQQASYLRSADTSANSRSLAKRAIKQGLDFNSIAIAEVKQMKEHLAELDDIDDREHYVSFYSQETTLQGIRTVCELVDENDTIDHMSALEILQLLNIVGIPCTGPIGDFPDPKTYHLQEVLLGSTVSIADIMMVKQSGNDLKDPFLGKKIINVVPFYDDDRIQQFLMKYGKTLLEYTASLGMRNMILDIPHTYKYTIVGGLWNMAQRLDKEKTAKNVDIFAKLVMTYRTAVDGLFDNVIKYIKEPTPEDMKENRSFYICNNGTTNMISPLINIMEGYYTGSNQESIKYVPNILRALYSFEFYQVTRKFHRSDDDKILRRKRMLDAFLGIDFEKYGTALPPLFESHKEPKHHREHHISQDMFQDFVDRVWWMDKITSLPDLILNAFKGKEGLENMLKTPPITPESASRMLGLKDDMDLNTFKFYCLVQSFLYDSKAARVDSEHCRMIIEDCGNKERMDKMVQVYVEKQYRADYQARLSQQKKLEREMLAKELVDKMIKVENLDKFIDLFRNGLKRNHVSVLISDTYQLGYTILRERLFDPAEDVKQRRKKLIVLILGVDPQEKPVWNKGNALRVVSVNELAKSFAAVGLEKFWTEKLGPLYLKRKSYSYRESDIPNRHSHCNSKASFWAFGYSTVGKYFAAISEDEQKEYMKIHTNCCGIWNGKLVKPA